MDELKPTTIYPAGTSLGLLGDSHGRHAITQRAVELLTNDRHADVLIYLGDSLDTRVLDALAGHCAHVVFGNCDWDWRSQADYGRSIGLHVDHPLGLIQVGEHLIMYAHGDDSHHEALALGHQISYFCHGHTHLVRDERYRTTRMINPGALTRARRYTVAWLDPQSDQLDFLPVSSEG